jgi:hypothetical protein
VPALPWVELRGAEIPTTWKQMMAPVA